MLIKHIQEQMKNEYKLNEVWIPENKDIDPSFHDLPKSNIYMSPDFSEEFTGQRNEAALILI